MKELNLSIAVGDYDQIRDLTYGVVKAPGISLVPSHLPVEEMFFRFTKFQEWDLSEMSFAKAIALISQPTPWLALLPVFPSRAFRHSSIYVRKDRHIRSPQDLIGKKIGIPEWAQTAAIYTRGMLQTEYGLDLTKIDWYQAGVNEAGRREKVELKLPAGIRYTPRPDSSLSAMLASGEIDAAFSARPPAVFLQADSPVERLFPEYRDVELDYWKRTGIFPIMHVLAMRRDVYERNRWIVGNLMQGFEQAKSNSCKRLLDITASSMPLPWIADYAMQSQAIMGSSDIWPYGVQPNLATLNAFCDYAWEQGITQRKMAPQEIFVPESLERVKV